MKDNTPLDDTTPDPNNTEQETATAQRPTTEPQKEKKNSTPGAEGKEPNEDDIVLPSVIEMTDDELFFSGKAFLDLVSGTMLSEKFRRNWGFILLIVALVLSYVALGYLTRAEMIENDRLSREALNWRYKALTRSSELRERTLRSNIENRLPDSTLRTPTESPYELPVEKEEEK